MRVLALMTEAFGGYGGIAQYNRDLLEAMSDLPGGHIVEVVVRYARDAVGVLPPRVRQHPARPERPLFALKAAAVAERFRPELVFCGHLHLSPLAAWIARRRHARLAHQAHGVEVWPRPEPLRRRCLESSDLVLCVSRDTRARVLEWADVPPERVRVAPNTLGEAFSPGDGAPARARLGVEGRKVILSVSRLDGGQRHKGQDRIIRLLPALASQGLDVIYLIAGEGDDGPRLLALAAAEGVADRVRLLGRIPASELPELYRAADLFAMPSTGDGFGIAYLEAMACGAPALGLDVGGVADALADGALGILADESGLPEAVAAALTAPRPGPPLAAQVRARFGCEQFRHRLQAALTPLAPPHAMGPA